MTSSVSSRFRFSDDATDADDSSSLSFELDLLFFETIRLGMPRKLDAMLLEDPRAADNDKLFNGGVLLSLLFIGEEFIAYKMENALQLYFV